MCNEGILTFYIVIKLENLIFMSFSTLFERMRILLITSWMIYWKPKKLKITAQ